MFALLILLCIIERILEKILIITIGLGGVNIYGLWINLNAHTLKFLLLCLP